jgi:hypothetical protein
MAAPWVASLAVPGCRRRFNIVLLSRRSNRPLTRGMLTFASVPQHLWAEA